MAAVLPSPSTSLTGSAGTWTSSSTTRALTSISWPTAFGRRRARSPSPSASAGTLNGVFSATKVQFLHADEARPQHLLEPPVEVDGLRIAGLSDLMAMVLKVVGDRGELRDYFDLMTIEQRTGRTADEGLALFVARFPAPVPSSRRSITSCSVSDTSTTSIPTMPCPCHGSRSLDHWTRRQPEIVAARGRLFAG